MDASVSLLIGEVKRARAATLGCCGSSAVARNTIIGKVGRSFGGARWAFGIGSVFHGDKIFFFTSVSKIKFLLFTGFDRHSTFDRIVLPVIQCIRIHTKKPDGEKDDV